MHIVTNSSQFAAITGSKESGTCLEDAELSSVSNYLEDAELSSDFSQLAAITGSKESGTCLEDAELSSAHEERSIFSPLSLAVCIVRA